MRAVVVGAGMAGLTAAWWLARDGWDVVVLERHGEPSRAGFAIDFFGPGYEVADRMGLLPRLRETRVAIDEVTYLDPAGRFRGRIDYVAAARALDGRVLSIARGELAAALRDAVADGVDLRFGAAVVGGRADATDAGVTLADGAVVEGDLLVGADGLHSAVRDVVVAPGRDPVRPLGYHTGAFRLSDADLERRVGRRAVLVCEPGRQAAFYPVRGGGLAAWFLLASDDPLPDDPAAALRTRFRGMGRGVDAALEHCPDGSDVYYDLVAQTEVDRWVAGRAVLVGDACHAPSLMAGQGASMAMAGAWCLADRLRRADDVATGLDGYASAMRPFADARKARGRSGARWLLPDSPWRIRARQAVLALAHLPGSEGLVRRSAGGTVGADLPG